MKKKKKERKSVKIKKIQDKKRKRKKKLQTMKSQFSHGLILHFIPHQRAFKVSITNVKWNSSKFIGVI